MNDQLKPTKEKELTMDNKKVSLTTRIYELLMIPCKLVHQQMLLNDQTHPHKEKESTMDNKKVS